MNEQKGVFVYRCIPLQRFEVGKIFFHAKEVSNYQHGNNLFFMIL